MMNTPSADILIIGGGMAYTFLKAMGKEIGKSLLEEDKIDMTIELMKKAEEKGVKLDIDLDADDMVARYFVERILEKTKDEPDVIELSWRTLTRDNWDIDQRLRSEDDRLSNPSVCTRVFKRSFIGDIRFNTKKDSTEDEDFARKVGYKVPLGDDKPLRDNKTVVITDYMYFYRTAVVGSNSKRYIEGLRNCKRIVYYYDHVTADMTDLLDEIRKEDETNEVILLTNQNDLPELRKYCQIKKPQKMRTEPDIRSAQNVAI